MPNPKIMVTDGAGFIGTNLVRFLLQETEQEVINVDKLTYAGNLYSLEDVANAACAASKRNVIFCHDAARGEEDEIADLFVMW